VKERSSQRAGSHRLFFAIWPSEAQQQLIERELRPRVESSGGRPIPAHNLHVTLAFLGEVPEPRVEVAKACASRVGPSAGFDLRFDRVETWARSRVLSLTTQLTPPALGQMAEGLRFNLLNAEFEIRQEDYRPHVTLARDVKRRGREQSIPPIEWRVEEFVLVQSEPGPNGSRYTIVERWPLVPPI
jgi:2'-5' RNA ligase